MNRTTKTEHWRPEGSLGALITLTSLKMRQRAKNDLAKMGLGHISVARFWVMHELDESPRNQATLCKRLKQSAPSMMEMLERLRVDGLVKFTAEASDPRKKRWDLTPRGRKDYLKARETLRDIGRGFDKIFQENEISDLEVDRFKQILQLLNDDFFREEQRV